MRNLSIKLFLLLFPMITANAQVINNVDHIPEPSNTGAYAFAFIDHATDARIGDRIIIDVRLDAGKDNLGYVQGGMFRIKIPFAQWVEIEANAVSDQWQITEAVRERYNLKSTRSKFDGDLNFKTKIRILKETEKRPALAFQATLKTAAGDFASTHRYTDSAGYEFSVIASKDIFESQENIIRKVRFLTELAFIAWDTNVAQQNDSLKASTGIQVEGEKFKMKVSFLGFYGWQNPSADYVSTLQFEAAKNLKSNVQIYGQANFGISKAATPILIGGGIRYFLAAPKKKRKSFLYN